MPIPKFLKITESDKNKIESVVDKFLSLKLHRLEIFDFEVEPSRNDPVKKTQKEKLILKSPMATPISVTQVHASKLGEIYIFF